jgi:O-antigen ligase
MYQFSLKFQEYLFYIYLVSLSFPIFVVKWTYGLWLFSFGIYALYHRPKLIKENVVLAVLFTALLLVRFFSSVVHSELAYFIKVHFDNQLSYLVLPILLLYNRSSINLIRVLKLLIAGNLVAMIYFLIEFLLLRFHIIFINQGVYNAFPTSNSIVSIASEVTLFQNTITLLFKHRAAMGLCGSISLASLFYLIRVERHFNKRKFLYIGAIIFIAFYIYFTGSRSGLIVMVVLFVLGLISIFRKNKLFQIISLALVIALFGVISTMKLTRNLMLNEIFSLDYSKIRVLDPRFSIWEVGVDLSKSNFWTGVGMSHIQDVLCDEYAKRGMTLCLHERYNTHNQFLHFWLESGIFAMLLFLFILGYLINKSSNRYLTVCLVVSYIIVSSLEDTLIQISSIAALVAIILIATHRNFDENTTDNLKIDF